MDEIGESSASAKPSASTKPSDEIWAKLDFLLRSHLCEATRTVGVDIFHEKFEIGKKFGLTDFVHDGDSGNTPVSQVVCQAWIKQGDPKDVILNEVKRLCPNLLVVGSRGLGPFQKVFVGTVSEFCWKHAKCQVMTIKRNADETPRDPVDD